MNTALNILIYFNDDHAQWASGTYGNRELRTPNIDRLAAAGIQMQHAFTPTPVCSPGRACFLTGRLASQHGLHDYLATTDPEIYPVKWLDDEILLPRILASRGYQTAYSGKWHLGQDDQHHPDFEYWFSICGDYPFHHNDNTRYCDNGTERFIPGYTTDVITDHSLRFFKERDTERPFFLMVGYTATHSPWEGQPERLVERYRDCTFTDIPQDETYPFGDQALESTMLDRSNLQEARAQYYAAVSHLDEGLGNILDELNANGLREDTLVIYTSDHGLNTGHHGIWGKGNGTRPLNMVEESIRIPMILSQPGRFPAGVQVDQFVDHLDLFQTVLECVGIDTGYLEDRNYPGESFLHILEHPEEMTPRRKVQFGEYGTLRMVRTERYKLVLRHPDGPHGLFDLETDPREMTNLYSDPAFDEIIRELTEQITRYFGQYEVPENSGLRGAALKRCNSTEVWREC